MLSIIIPTYNEADYIQSTIRQLWKNDTQNLIKEIIIADGGSTDNTCSIARSEGVRVVNCPQKGRAAQMNFGAFSARSEILYFLHADTLPPPGFTTMIIGAVQHGVGAGCFMLSFDHPNWFLKANCWFTRFDVDAIRFGDQSLFVTKKVFQQAGGFCEKHIILEDQHLIKRLKKLAPFTIIKKPVITSARKYIDNGIYKTQGIFFYIYLMYRMGFTQQQLITSYRRMIKQDKL